MKYFIDWMKYLSKHPNYKFDSIEKGIFNNIHFIMSNVEKVKKKFQHEEYMTSSLTLNEFNDEKLFNWYQNQMISGCTNKWINNGKNVVDTVKNFLYFIELIKQSNFELDDINSVITTLIITGDFFKIKVNYDFELTFQTNYFIKLEENINFKNFIEFLNKLKKK